MTPCFEYAIDPLWLASHGLMATWRSLLTTPYAEALPWWLGTLPMFSRDRQAHRG